MTGPPGPPGGSARIDCPQARSCLVGKGVTRVPFDEEAKRIGRPCGLEFLADCDIAVAGTRGIGAIRGMGTNGHGGSGLGPRRLDAPGECEERDPRHQTEAEGARPACDLGKTRRKGPFHMDDDACPAGRECVGSVLWRALATP